MNGNKVNSKDQFYFDKLYNSNNGQIIGIKETCGGQGTSNM